MLFASKIFLVRPSRFGYNPQTADSNSLQQPSDQDDAKVSRMAIAEFGRVAEGLAGRGIEVVIADDPPDPHTPDAVFPNNWFSTHPDGKLVLYPMEAAARRLERVPSHVETIRRECGSSEIVDLTGYEADGRFLEGTGSLVIDHESDTVYASVSSRTDPGLAKKWSEMTGHELILFNARGKDGAPVYHTNILLCIGNGFAVFCPESVDDGSERSSVIDSLEASGREVVMIGLDQMEDFAGNALQLRTKDGEPLLAMSERAKRAFSRSQLSLIEKHTSVAAFDIPTIELCGGGSVRCMIAELFGK